MKKLSWQNGNLFERVKNLKAELKGLQQRIDVSPFDVELRKKVSKDLKEYKEAVEDEEKLLFQKARIDWLKDGDKNSAYFHKDIKGRLHSIKVVSICDEQGKMYEGEGILEQFVQHFKRFLRAAKEVQPIDDPEGLFTKKIQETDAARMIGEITNEEIKEAMFDIGDNKAPGPIHCKILQTSLGHN